MGEMGQESDSELSIEARTLIAFGYGHCLDAPVPVKEGVVGRNFLDAYGDSPHRQTTEYIMEEFAEMSPDDPYYETTRDHIAAVFKSVFGPPIMED